MVLRLRAAILAALAAVALLAPAAPVAAQEASSSSQDLQKQIQESQRRLEEIRAERDRLEKERESARTGAQDAAAQLRNAEQRLSASRSAMAELQFQIDATSEDIHNNNRNLIRTRERLAEGSAVLLRRLRDIYKMGQLHTVRVLLGAESFPDLLNRYRYLRLVASYDRSLVDHVTSLESGLVEQDTKLHEAMADLGRLHQARVEEMAQLRAVEAEHQRALAGYRSREQQATSRLDQLQQDAQRMMDLVADLDRRRREEESRRAAAGARAPSPTLAASDAGSLAWPVDGSILYRFGRDRRPNGTVLRWNGIGIAAPTGTPVRAVKAGTVVLAGPFEGYGPTVVLSHGDGFYTLYLYLEDVGVVEGRHVDAGQVVGTVGGSGTPEGPHIEFQVRAPLNGGSPEAQDPLRWLRPQGKR